MPPAMKMTNVDNYQTYLMTLSLEELEDLHRFSSERKALRDCAEWRISTDDRSRAISTAIAVWSAA